MTKDNSRLETALDDLIKALDREAGMPFAAVLYGSAARGDWDPLRSDVNLLLVVEDASPTGLERVATPLMGWHQERFTSPLLIARDEWQRATDVFPIEITDMKLSYRVLAGDDPVAGLVVAPDDLRRALEEAYRGKLVRLRQAYVRFGTSTQTLGGFAAATSSELLVLLRATAVLLGREPGADAPATLDSLAEPVGPAIDSLRDVIARRREPEWSCPVKLYAGYLEAIARLVTITDKFRLSGVD